MRTKFAVALAIAAVCVTTAWADWSPEALVTGGEGTQHSLASAGRTMVFGSDGIGHLAWGYGSEVGIGCSRYDPSSGWGSERQVSPRGSSPAIALDADGTNLHLVWNDTHYAAICYQKCTRQPNGSDQWGPIVPLRSRFTVEELVGPSVASVPNDPDHVAACWYEEHIPVNAKKGGQFAEAIGFIECIDGVWGTPIRLDSSATDWRRVTSIAVGSSGDVFIAYINGSGHVCVKTRHNGSWGATVDVTAGFPTTDRCGVPAIEVNPVTGNPHVVFSWMRIIQVNRKLKDTLYAAYHTYRNSQGEWLPVPELISTPRNRAHYGFPDHRPKMAFIDNGAAYAVWEESDPVTSRGVQYSYNSVEGGTWTSPAWLNSDTASNYRSGSPHVAYCGTAQTVHVVWSRCYDTMFGISTEIWWTSNYLGGDGPHALPMALSQSSIELFPNPAKSGRVTVQYALPKAGPLTAKLLDVSGRAVRTQGVAATGTSGSFTVDANGLYPGVYVLKLGSGSTSQTRKLVIQ